MKKMLFKFSGKVKDLLEAIEWEMDMKEQQDLEEGFRENNFCDNYGYCCGSSCKNYGNCKEVN